MKLFFIGDIVAEPGLEFLEAQLPGLIARHRPDFVIANAENLVISPTGAGLSAASLERLWTLGVDAVTGGNHSWDGSEGAAVHADPRVLRPINRGAAWPGRGALILEKNGLRLGVLNAASRTSIPDADAPLPTLEAQLERWGNGLNAVLLDFHGESVFEKLSLAFALDGRVTAFLGTHTHVPTSDLRLLPQGSAYLSEVGMTGAGGGIQGYAPEAFVTRFQTQGFTKPPKAAASGPIEFGAVRLEVQDGTVRQFARLEVAGAEP